MKLLNLLFASRKEAEAPERSERTQKVQYASLYAISSGRSMVEMLGVLAIVGVLSIGAIAGYAKAMMKYKLNKHAESFNTLLNNAIRIRPELDRAFNGTMITEALFETLKLIPDGMTYRKSQSAFYDVFQTRYHIVYNDNGHNNGTMHYYMGITLDSNNNKLTNQSLELCRNIFIVAKENADNIYAVQVRSITDESYTYTGESLLGGLANTTNSLKSADLQKIHEVCDSCDYNFVSGYFQKILKYFI